MSIARSAAEVLRDHVVLELEAIDRMYLNVYVPHLQTVGAVVGYVRVHKGQRFASTTAVAPMTDAFVRNIEDFVNNEGIDLVTFEKWQRKDDVTQKYLRRFTKSEGVLYVGKAQEKARIMRTQRRRSRLTGGTYPWIVESTAMVNHYYFYCVDEDFGPFFLKFCSYFPYNAKLCINGHEYLKRQLAKRGVEFEALDNGIKSCADPKLMQQLCDGLSANKIDRLLRKWLRRLPHPFPARDRAAGYRYQLSILQAEFSLTQVLDQPVTGRVFFEEVIRENLDIGRPSQVSLVFDRKVSRRTPGRFRTRVITDGVVPSLHVDYKKTRIKQYHKEGQALRTETTINDTRDFAIGRRIKNLEELRKIGFAANRRLLDVQRIGHNCFIGEACFQEMQRPVGGNDQRAAALRFADPRVQALLHVLLLFLLVQGTFRHRDIREHLAPLLGQKPSQFTPGRITYDLRRLRLHGLIERIPRTHRYRITAKGLRTALFFTRLYDRSLRTGLAIISSIAPDPELPMAKSIRAAETAINNWYEQEKLAA
jgi:DNA-binding PadR family transcriptional regulator